jgi:hypothetical protein
MVNGERRRYGYLTTNQCDLKHILAGNKAYLCGQNYALVAIRWRATGIPR